VEEAEYLVVLDTMLLYSISRIKNKIVKPKDVNKIKIMHDTNNIKYSLGLSSFPLMRSEIITAAHVFKQYGDWKETKQKILKDNLLQRKRESTSKVACNETLKRLKKAEDWELDFLEESDDVADTSFICLQLISRHYLLLRDIILDLICYKAEGMDYSLAEYEIIGWYNKLGDTHDELEHMKPGSFRRLIINTRLVLEDGGLIKKTSEDLFKIIVPQISESLKSLYLKNGSITDLKLILLTDSEIRKVLGDRE